MAQAHFLLLPVGAHASTGSGTDVGQESALVADSPAMTVPGADDASSPIVAAMCLNTVVISFAPRCAATTPPMYGPVAACPHRRPGCLCRIVDGYSLRRVDAGEATLGCSSRADSLGGDSSTRMPGFFGFWGSRV